VFPPALLDSGRSKIGDGDFISELEGSEGSLRVSSPESRPKAVREAILAAGEGDDNPKAFTILLEAPAPLLPFF
jgi:hypothetical protein